MAITPAPVRLGEPVTGNFVLYSRTQFLFVVSTHRMLNRPTTEERLSSQRGPQGFMRYFLLLMTMTYIGLGIYLWLAPPPALNLSLTSRRILGGVFVFYGIIRFVRTYQQHFRNTDSQHE